MYECKLDIVDTVVTKDLLTRLAQPLKDKTAVELIPLVSQFGQESLVIFRANPSFINLYFCCSEVFKASVTLQVSHSKGLYHLKLYDNVSGNLLAYQSSKYSYVALRKLIYRWIRKHQ